MKQYKKIGLGGTFDHFHKGHQAFLLFAADLAEELVIGVTTPELIKHKKFAASIESYQTRANAVSSFFKHLSNSVQIIPLTDPFGPTLVGSSIEALAVTADTKNGAEAINQQRQQLGLKPLPIHTQIISTDDQGEVISSERIRAGLINRDGFVYSQLFQKKLKLSPDQKKYLSLPQGDLVKFPAPSKNIFVVGDSSLEIFLAHQWPYQLGIIDYLKERKDYSPHVKIDETDAVLQTTNPAGEISAEMAVTVNQALAEKMRHIVVHGEEDLSAVVLLMLAPLGSFIYYGQPGQGMVEMEVTEEKKEQIKVLLT